MSDPLTALKAKIGAQWVPRIEGSIRRAAEVLSDPNSPREACDALDRELASIQQKAGTDALQAYCDQVRKVLRERLLMQGVALDQVDEMVEDRVSRVVEKVPSLPQMENWVQNKAVPYAAQKARDREAEIGRKIRRVASAVGVAVFAFIVVINFQYGQGMRNGLAQLGDSIYNWIFTSQRNSVDPDAATIQIPQEELQDFENSLVETRAENVSQRAAVTPLPPPVAAIQEEPVQITLRGNSYHTTVGSLYQSSSTPPPVRQAIQEHAQQEYQYVTMTNRTHIYTPQGGEKIFKLGSWDGARNTDMGTITLGK